MKDLAMLGLALIPVFVVWRWLARRRNRGQ
jgi:hypothetical protein